LEGFSPSYIGDSAATIPSADSNAIVVKSQAALSFVLKMWPFAPIVAWSHYKQTYASTTEEDRFTRKLFGRKFIRAYLALMGSQDRK
jgi:hypothetical protein